MPRKPIVLTFVRHYLPGYKCGPIRSVANMVQMLGDRFDFRIVTLDRDLGDESPYPAIEADGRWRDVDAARVLYLSRHDRSFANIRRIVRETPHDVLYLNSFFDPTFSILPLLAIRLGLAPRSGTIIAPRGEFSAGALELKSTKKNSFLALAKLARLHGGLVWQATSDLEQEDIRRVMKGAAERIRVVPNLPSPVGGEVLSSPRIQGAPLRMCFLSRISPKKNLLFALDVLKTVRMPVEFDIYGPIEDEPYWRRCESTIADLPPHHSVRWQGSLEHEKVAGMLASYDLFILPTKGENFGHVIHEALSAGTPVLIAQTTPWRDLAADGAGWDLPLDEPDKFRDAIEQMHAMQSDQIQQMRIDARNLASRRSRLGDVVGATALLFLSAIQASGAVIPNQQRV